MSVLESILLDFILTTMYATKKMKQIQFIDLFKSALNVSGDKPAHPQERFQLYIQLLVQCTDVPADRCHRYGSNIGALYQKLYKQSKSAPEDGRVCCPKHVELI